jgi:hypothetical protein
MSTTNLNSGLEMKAGETSVGDIYRRVAVSANRYQCGCEWIRTWDEFGRGNRLVECVIHKQATAARVLKFERERGMKCQAVPR